MVAIIPPPIVEAKPTPSAPLRYGLFQAAIERDLTVKMRTGGLEYVHNMCPDGSGYEILCENPLPAKTFDADAGLAHVLGTPFLVYSTFVCGAVGYTPEQYRAFGLEGLKSIEQSLVEAVFSEGTFAQSPSLANNTPNASLVVGGGTTSAQVVSELETTFYCTNGYGVAAYLHVPIGIFNDLKERHMIEWDGMRWRTPLGTVVSTGCYVNQAPDGTPAVDGTFWLYITGQTVVWSTPDDQVFVSPIEGTLDRTNNQIRQLVEREYVVTYECTPYAKSVTLWS